MISDILVIIFAFLAGMEGVLDEFQTGCMYPDRISDRSLSTMYHARGIFTNDRLGLGQHWGRRGT